MKWNSTTYYASERWSVPFKPDPIPEDSLARILDAALRAPSAGHSQGQSYIVIQDVERKAEIAANCKEQIYIGDGLCTVHLRCASPHHPLHQ